MTREPIQIPFTPRNNHTVSVTLEPDVLARCAAFAEQIERANTKRRRKNVQGLTAKGRESLALRIRGLSGEAALAVYLGLPPVRIADEWRARPDVLCFDCITTATGHGALIITPRDRLDMMKVLIIDRSPVFHICGWYRVSDVRSEAQRSHSEWWRTEREHGGAWYVPQSFLRSLHDDEALIELALHGRVWRDDHFEAKEAVRGMMIDLVGATEKRISDDYLRYQGVDPDTVPFEPTDWREVLRRAGAAPSDSLSEHDTTDRGPDHGQG